MHLFIYLKKTVLLYFRSNKCILGDYKILFLKTWKKIDLKLLNGIVCAGGSGSVFLKLHPALTHLQHNTNTCNEEIQ